MAKKAISPLIAIVVLVALVVTLGGLLSVWLSTFFYDVSEHDRCAITTMYTLTGPTYNKTSGEIKAKVKNTGRDDLVNFTIEVDNGTVFAIIPVSSPADTYVLSPGRSQYVLANATFYNVTNIDTIKLLVASCRTYASSAVNVANI
jgi:flagellin-like protein